MALEGRYKLSPAAVGDLAEIWRYTARKWSPEQADTYQDQFVAAFEGLGAGTKKGRPVDVRPGYLSYPVGSHLIFYRERNSQIEVVRILHSRMDVNRRL
jgi:toxin ParE1/3/4